MRTPTRLAVPVAVLLLSAPVRAAEVAKKYLMASMGDSITAALFAGTNHVSASSDEPPVTPEDVEQAFMGSRVFEKKYTLSWSSGKDIPSHFVRLRDYLKASEGADLEVLNTASTGNKAEDLLRQARAVADAMKTGKYRALKYATLLIGANDVCFGGPTGTPDGVMRDSVKAALGILAAIPQQEPVRVLVSAIPDVASLGTRDIRDGIFARGITCGALWARLAICQPIVVWDDPEGYEARKELIRGKNSALNRALDEVASEHPNLQVAFTERTFQEPVKAPDLAIDCFHPNRGTQARLAAELWKEQPWFTPEAQALGRSRAAVSGAGQAVARNLERRPWTAEAPGPVAP